jgi:GNAT superfamily N-acetyltransferase
VSAFREEHVLPDGGRVTLRFIQPEDADELRRCFGRLSPQSRHQRFLGGNPQMTDAMLEYLTRVDGDEHVAIVAVCDSLDLKSDVGLGVARFVRLDDRPDVAEAAITVLDEAQGRGIGRLLMRALARLAAERGVRTFRGEVLAANAGMRHLLDLVGARIVPAQDGGGSADGPAATLAFEVPVPAPPEALEQLPFHPLRRLLRAAAEELRKLPRPPAI